MRLSAFRGMWWLVLIAGLYGCAAGISGQARSQVTFFGSFSELQRHPERYSGETVILGGKIIQVLVQDDATELTVLQLPLDRADRPLDSDQSEGRFLVRAAQFLDPALYPEGARITVVGKLTGSRERPIGSMPYRYPVVAPLEIKKWPGAQDRTPRFHFGIGVGTRF
jgi:outer membrane lipoprotein